MDGTAEFVFVLLEVVVGGLGAFVAFPGASGTLVDGWTAGGILGRVWILADRAVMMAVRKTEGRAEASILAKWADAFILPARNKASRLDVHPSRFRKAAVATRTASTEAHILRTNKAS